MSIQSTSSEWTGTRYLELKDRSEVELNKSKELQEKAFKKNYRVVAQKIADTFAEKIIEKLKTDRTNLISESSEKSFHLNFAVMDLRFDYTLMELAKETKDLAPFADWKKGIHYYSDQEIRKGIIYRKFSKIKKKVANNLKSILSDFQKMPGNSSVQFTIEHSFTNEYLDVSYRLDPSKIYKKPVKMLEWVPYVETL